MNIHFDEKGKIFTDIISKDVVPATIQTLTHIINGNVFVQQGERLIDELSACDQFLAVTDAVVLDHSGVILYAAGFLIVNRDHVVWILPKDEIKDDADGGGGKE